MDWPDGIEEEKDNPYQIKALPRPNLSLLKGESVAPSNSSPNPSKGHWDTEYQGLNNYLKEGGFTSLTDALEKAVLNLMNEKT